MTVAEGTSARLYRYASALYGAEKAIAAAIAYAPDTVAREGLAEVEAAIRREIRRQHFPSPDEPRMFWREEK